MEHVDAVAGEPIRIALPSHGGAGYLWRLRDEPPGLRLQGSESLAPESGAPPGSPHDTVFTLIATDPGTYAAVFVLQRPWESEPVEERVVTIEAGTSPGGPSRPAPGEVDD